MTRFGRGQLPGTTTALLFPEPLVVDLQGVRMVRQLPPVNFPGNVKSSRDNSDDDDNYSGQ